MSLMTFDNPESLPTKSVLMSKPTPASSSLLRPEKNVHDAYPYRTLSVKSELCLYISDHTCVSFRFYLSKMETKVRQCV